MTRGPIPAPIVTRMRSLLLFLRFGVVGLLNTAFGYATFAFFVVIGVWPGAALVASMIVAVAFNFQTSRRLVFRTRGCVYRFVALYALVLALNWAALRALHSIGMHDLVSQALLVVPLAALSFLGQSTFVFNASSETT